LPVFLSAIRGVDINVFINFSVRLDGATEDAYITLYKKSGETLTELYSIHHQQVLSGSSDFLYNGDIHLNAGDGLVLNVYKFGSTNALDYLYVKGFELDVTYQSRDLREVNIDLVKPITLLSNLLKSMNDGVDVPCEIATTDSRLNNTMLMAADSARGLDEAKIHSSYKKFVDWMSAEFGFVPVVSDKVTFIHRDTLFNDSEIKNLGSDLSGFDFSINAGMIYSMVRVGYDRVDYESVNGLDEFRFTNEYNTGTTLTDNSLELISPYRADAYGIQFLVNKRGEDTTDDRSDKAVFMVGAALNGGRYKLLRNISISGVLSPNKMFNVMYAHKFMIDANRKYIGAFSNLLSYASSDGNSLVEIEGVSGSSDISIVGQLFSVGQVNVESADISIPTDLSGYITFINNGKEYKGYVRDVSFNVGREEKVRYSLIVK